MQRFLPADKSQLDAPFRDHHFVRRRKLPLPTTIALTMNMVRPGQRFGYQEVVDRFFSATAGGEPGGEAMVPPDAGAFCKARQKVPLEVFQSLFDQAVERVGELSSRVPAHRWHGRRVLAIDGTKKNLPSSPELAAHFGVPEHAHFPQALVCTLYDVLAKAPVDVIWGPYRASERAMARQLYGGLGPDDVVLLDRGFPCFEILWDLAEQQTDVLVRLPKSGLFRGVREQLDRGIEDGLVTLTPPPALVRERVQAGRPAPEPLTLRVVRVRAPRGLGEPAIFLTTLTDRRRFRPRALSDLYHLRWEEEEFYKLVKALLQAENLRGTKCLLIHQELIAIYLYGVLARLLILEAAERHGIAPQEIAQQHAFLAVSRYLDHMLTAQTPEQCEELLSRCVAEIAWRRYQKRPGRSHPRQSKSSYGKWGRKGAAR